MNNFLSVKDVANKFSISEHTVRYYTDSGLIPTIKRDKNNNRVFYDESINWLYLVLCFKYCGMSIKSIKEYEILCSVKNSTLKKRYNIILGQKDKAMKEYEN